MARLLRGNHKMHVVKRLALVVIGFFLAVFVAVGAFAGAWVGLANLPDAPQRVTSMALMVVHRAVVIPDALALYAWYAAAAALPGLILGIVIEAFRARGSFAPMAGGALIAIGLIVAQSPELQEGRDPELLIDLAVAAAAGFAAGFVYWMIAARSAGFARRTH